VRREHARDEITVDREGRSARGSLQSFESHDVFNLQARDARRESRDERYLRSTTKVIGTPSPHRADERLADRAMVARAVRAEIASDGGDRTRILRERPPVLSVREAGSASMRRIRR
jgi:hypothetical protein